MTKIRVAGSSVWPRIALTLRLLLVECGFLSNEEDLRLLLTDEYKKQIVDGIIEGIEKCYE